VFLVSVCLVERRSPRKRREQVLARGLELIADESQVEQKNPEVVASALRIEPALAARCRAPVQGFGGHGQNQLDIGPHLTGVKRSLEPSELNVPPVPHVV
jgi:hypothetical protein